MNKHESCDIRVPIEADNPSLKRIESLCIRCGQCRDVCNQVISVGNHFSLHKTLDNAICIHCGQCIMVCPTQALTERKEWMEVERQINQPNKKVVFMTSPSVRVALAEEFGAQPGEYVEKKMVQALRTLGADYVFDTTFAADLTIMEEASELIDRIQNQKPLPQFTSCCPAWVKFVETYYPEKMMNLSSSKSPISMFGPTVKTYFAKQANLNPDSIVTVALTPCTAKKFEIRRPEMNAASKHNSLSEKRDTDYVITTRELAEWLKAKNLDLQSFDESDYDDLMPRGSGAGIIFGNSGGVMEAALRTAYWMLTKKNLAEDELVFMPVRGLDGIKEATIEINDLKIRVAVIHGTANARKFLTKMETSEPYHFVEVMTCPGGCIGGGGQPIPKRMKPEEVRAQRIAGLYQQDEKMKLRLSHENLHILQLYKQFYDHPLSSLAEEILHTHYIDRSQDLHEDPSLYHELKAESVVSNPKKTVQYQCELCGYIHEGNLNEEPSDYVCPICFAGKELFVEKEQDATVVHNEGTAEVLTEQYRCELCGYIHEGNLDEEPSDYVCPICFAGKELFVKI